MFDDQFRVIKEKIFVMLAQTGLGRVSPLWLSLIGMLFGVATAVSLTYGLYIIAFILWFFNRVFDGLDGTVARLSNAQSDLGGYVDILVDFVIYALIPIGLALGRPSTPGFLVLIFLLATYYVNAASWMYLSAILEKRSLSRTEKLTTVNMPAGLIGGAATILFYSLFILFPRFYIQLFVLMGILVLVTILQRLWWAWRNL